MDSDSWLLLCRTVRFGDTDAAGVLHFPRLLDWCHQAYEESLERYGLAASDIFPSPHHTPAVALPVVHCQADFLAPLVVGDPLNIRLEPRRLDPGSFELQYCFLKEQQPAARALSRHLAIDSASRRRCPLPPAINRWLEASAIGQGIQPVQEPVAHRLSGDSENRSGALP
jgi:1,4-dihydroxy-2-naphthoyl-CoA hydrolase